MDEWCADYYITVWLVSCQSLVKLLCKCNTLLEIHVHLPVTGYNVLSHFKIDLMVIKYVLSNILYFCIILGLQCVIALLAVIAASQHINHNYK